MTQAVTVRRDGDTFQARLFWKYAARLLDPQSPIIKVGFEQGPKSFDDIWVEYDPSLSRSDQNGHPLVREHIQCKWHVTPDYYGFSHLTDPEFINANARSLLQRAREAQASYAPEGIGIRFQLMTNWRILREDPLREIVSNRSSTIRLDRLYGTLTDNSKVGAIRKAWREHLGIDELELRKLARTLSFGESGDSLDGLRERLDELFAYVGLRRIPANETAFPYDSTVFEWMAQERQEFDRESFRAACKREDLLSAGTPKPFVFGVKSFEHAIDRLQDRCTDVLDFVAEFDERYIRNEADWESKLYPELKRFLLEAAVKTERLRLALDAHATLAFAAGSVINIKSGRAVDLEQRTTDRKVWAADDCNPDVAWQSLSFETVDLDQLQTDIAVVVGLTHDIVAQVRPYVEKHLPQVGRLLVARPQGGASARSVACGRHAFDLAESITAAIRTAKSPVSSTVHLFVAAPNAFTFFLGQRQPVMGRVRLYEFDFEGGRDGSYQPALTLPIS